MRIIFTRIGCTLLTCDMYMSDLRHIHDPVLSSLKVEGIRILFFLTSSIITSLKSRDVKQRSARRCSKLPLSLGPRVLV
jgi:hypothetical protein